MQSGGILESRVKHVNPDGQKRLYGEGFHLVRCRLTIWRDTISFTADAHQQWLLLAPVLGQDQATFTLDVRNVKAFGLTEHLEVSLLRTSP